MGPLCAFLLHCHLGAVQGVWRRGSHTKPPSVNPVGVSRQLSMFFRITSCVICDICTIIAGCFVVLCVFWGSQSRDPLPFKALKIEEAWNFPLEFLG